MSLRSWLSALQVTAIPTILIAMTLQAPAQTEIPIDQQARVLFEATAGQTDKGEKAEKEIQDLITLHNPEPPILQRLLAYKASAQLLQARDAFWPFKKVKYARMGLDLLDKAVQEAPTDIEVRLIRLNCTLPLPHFLKDDKKLEEDLRFLLGSRDQLKDKPESTRLYEAIVKSLERPEAKKALDKIK